MAHPLVRQHRIPTDRERVAMRCDAMRWQPRRASRNAPLIDLEGRLRGRDRFSLRNTRAVLHGTHRQRFLHCFAAAAT